MNNPHRKLTSSLCFSAAIVLSAVGAAQAQPAPADAPMSKDHMQQSGTGSADMNQSKMSGMDGMQKMQMSGDTDKDFAMMMKMHHQQALDMAQIELEHGSSPELKAMAKKIIVGQKKEIAEFDRWMKTHP